MNDGWQISRKVVEWMEKNLDPKSRVFEIGGGRGSKRIQTRFPNSLTLEHDPQWVGYLLRASCRVMHRPLVDGWYDLDDELREEIGRADVVIIDAPPGYLRTNILPHLHLIKEGATIIIDDTHRAKVRKLIQDPIIAIVRDEKRMTHITKKKKNAEDPNQDQARSLDHPKPKRGRGRKAISKPKVEEVSEVVSLDESALHSMPSGSQDR